MLHLHVPTFKLCISLYSIETYMYLVVLYSWCKEILRVYVSVCHQKSMVAHLVVFRPGLWRQTAGDEEESSALQFRTVPTEHLRLTNHESVCLALTCCTFQ